MLNNEQHGNRSSITSFRPNNLHRERLKTEAHRGRLIANQRLQKQHTNKVFLTSIQIM